MGPVGPGTGALHLRRDAARRVLQAGGRQEGHLRLNLELLGRRGERRGAIAALGVRI